MQFTGAFTALVTPFKNGSVDEDKYRELIEWQIEQGIDGLVPCGTTGESATLSHEEHRKLISICVDQVNKRVPVLAGAGSNNTLEAIELTRHAKEAGADAAMLITPYYNKPTQEGLYQHFKALAKEVNIPFIIYNVPGRTGVMLQADTLARMRRDIAQVVGTKDATADLNHVSDILEQCGRDFTVLSGDDFTVLPSLAVGGAGCISVVANVAPAKMAGMCKAWREGDMETAQRLHFELQPLNRAMFLETNPIPVKTAVGLMGKLDFNLRLPLVPMQDENLTRLKKVLADSNLI